ncbi:MAG: heme o synthase [Bacteroidetes bacterium]|nr:heme o synthase [Bacteroidota bacterium]MCB0850756.1 heme o synthase [Bacteroidota bacterium]
MISEQVGKISYAEVIRQKVAAYAQLLKFRLSFLVSLSAVFGYAIAAGDAWTTINLIWIGLGGMMVTGASNTLNQIIEKDSDKLMRRTSGRPIPEGRISIWGAFVYALFLAAGGIYILGNVFNFAAALLGMFGLISYAFMYTPMKKVSGISVFIGAIPGGLPPLIGWVAYTGEIGMGGILLFIFQFLWQFPHFWAIAWLMDDDYQKAGLKMLPSAKGRTKFSAFLVLLYTFLLIPMALYATRVEMIGTVGALVLIMLGLLFLVPAFGLYRSLDGKYARKVMFASFLYLPLAQLTFLFG